MQVLRELRGRGAGDARGELVCCVEDSTVLEPLLYLTVEPVIILEPSLARAMLHCLEHEDSRLVVELAALDGQALSALVQFRLMRPKQEIILLGGKADAGHLRHTLLRGLPVIPVPRRRPMDRLLLAGR